MTSTAWDFSKIPVFSPDRASRPQSSSALSSLPLPGILQRKLVVGEVNDPLEHEADRVADQVMRVPDPELPLAGTATQISRKSEADYWESGPQHLRPHTASAGGETPAVLSSSGEFLATPTRAYFEPRLRFDFGTVRIHTDHRAASAARSLGAAAFTVGSDIAFAAGRYQPGTDAGRRLLAHELVHVVQQSGGAPGMVQATPLCIQRSVETLGGEWLPEEYKDVPANANGTVGVTMTLHFKAKDPVDATRIGLTQMVNTVFNGVPLHSHFLEESRSIPAGQPDAGSHIDRLPKYSLPYFGATNLNAPLSPKNQWGQHSRFLGLRQHSDAVLFDEPTVANPGPNSSQLFETAAIAVAGKQKDTFYGSVRWGWRTDANNKFTREPLSVVSDGVPSESFKESARLWNASKTSTGQETVDLPIPAGSESAQMPSPRDRRR